MFRHQWYNIMWKLFNLDYSNKELEVSITLDVYFFLKPICILEVSDYTGTIV